MRLKLMPHQAQFCADHTSDYLGLIGGFGCGKTKAFCYKTIIMAGLNAGFEGAIAEPTNYLVATHLIPNLEAALLEMGVPYDHDKSHNIFHMHFAEGTTKVYCLSGENYQRLVGYNLAFFGSDETDTTGPLIADEMWNKAISRVRWGPHRQIYSTSTPEGHRFLFKFFVEEPEKAAEEGRGSFERVWGAAKGVEGEYIKEHRASMQQDDEVLTRRAIHATTYDNPLMDAPFIAKMRAKYTPEQWKVWALGQFGNLHSSRVYYSYDRDDNWSDYQLGLPPSSEYYIPDYVELGWGLDFNIDHMAAVGHVEVDGNPHAILELVDIKDVPTMIKRIKEASGPHPVVIYPDASGQNRNATGSTTAMQLLKQAGFKIVVNGTNPGVGDRINSMNAMFLNADDERRYRVNTRLCPQYTRSLEQQAWIKGQPDKSNNIDHVLDAGGYYIHKNWPLTGRPTAKVY